MKNILASGNSTTPDVVGLLDPMCHFVLFALLLEYEVLLCLQLVENSQQLVLMIYNHVVDTVSCWCIGINASYINSVVISYSLSERCNVAEASLGDVSR